MDKTKILTKSEKKKKKKKFHRGIRNQKLGKIKKFQIGVVKRQKPKDF